MVLDIQGITLAVIIGTLAAIVYSLRVLVLLEKRIARIEVHVEKMTGNLIKKVARQKKKKR